LSKILVLGDAILDRYLIGEAKGLSPEGAFPLVLMKNDYEDYRVGGAANCANCIKKLLPEATVDLMSIIGNDFSGVKLRQMLEKTGIGFEDTMFYTNKHPTILKTRVCIGNRQIVRYDIEDESNLDSEQLSAIINKLNNIARDYEVIVVSDYNKGIVNGLTFACVSLNSNGFILVDPKKKDFGVYKQADMITPNMKEFALATDSKSTLSKKDIAKKSRSLMLNYGIKNVLVTMSESGMLHVSGNKSTHYPTMAKSVVDVVGAGDTVVATIAAMKASGKSMKKCIEAANIAAGLVIGKFGTDTITMDELKEKL